MPNPIPHTCPTCGTILPSTDVRAVLTPTELKIYDYVAKRPGCTMEQIFDHLYYHRPDGGPLNRNTVSVLISRMNRVNLHRHGETIHAHRRGPGAEYRIYPLKEAQ